MDDLLYRAKLAEQVDRYEEMAEMMKMLVCTKRQPLTDEERSIFAVAFKNVSPTAALVSVTTNGRSGVGGATGCMEEGIVDRAAGAEERGSCGQRDGPEGIRATRRRRSGLPDTNRIGAVVDLQRGMCDLQTGDTQRV